MISLNADDTEVEVQQNQEMVLTFSKPSMVDSGKEALMETEKEGNYKNAEVILIPQVYFTQLPCW